MYKFNSINKRAVATVSFVVFACYGVTESAEKPLYGPIMLHFLSGSLRLDKPALKKLERVRELLSNTDLKKIRVDGFTDNTPVSPDSGYKDNVELGVARAKKVALLLRKNTKIPVEFFTTTSSGSKEYISSNNTARGRAMNRRVEVRVYGEPGRAKPPSQVDDIESDSREEILETLTFRNTSIEEAFEMLSKKGKVNIVLQKGVEGMVSLNLFNVTLEKALETVADSAGFVLTRSSIGYTVSPVKTEAKVTKKKKRVIKTFKIEYFKVDHKLKEELSRFLTDTGVISLLLERNVIIVEDTEEAVKKLETLILNLDVMPRQILIEARIMEVSLDESETFGLDWSKIFSVNGGSGSGGVKNLTTGTSGFIFQMTNKNVDIFFNSLHKKGKVRTLSTPKLLTMENKEASVIIGDRQGFKVTTTIDQVTTESIEFLESGIKLRVIASVDRTGKILMQIIPEVSTGSIQDGIPAQVTTKVTTTLRAENGQPVFIGGLMKNRVIETKNGVPILEKIPLLSRLFSSSEESFVKTETVVIITPHIIDKPGDLNFPEEETIKLF